MEILESKQLSRVLSHRARKDQLYGETTCSGVMQVRQLLAVPSKAAIGSSRHDVR